MARAKRRPTPGVLAGALAVLMTAAGLAGCGGGGAEGGTATVVVTTDILGDLVTTMVGDDADVVTVMPPGASPHDFQPSARQARDMRTADLLVVNGGGLEEGLLATVEAAEADGVAVHEAIEGVDALVIGDDDHDHSHDGDDDGHAHDAGDGHGAGDRGHDHDVDPHFLTDPVRTAQAVEGIAAALAEHVPGLDTPGQQARVDGLRASLAGLDGEVRALLDPIAPADRVLVTDHGSLRYFADRYGFEVLGTVVPSSSPTGEAAAAHLAELADVIEERGVRAVFVEASAPSRAAEALAADAGGLEVVAVNTESLGEPGSGADTHAGMIRANAEAIADALG